MSVSQFSRFDYLFSGRSRLAVADVLYDRASEKIHVLLNDSDVVPKALELNVPDVLTVDPDGTSGNIVKPRYQAAQSRFAAA